MFNLKRTKIGLEVSAQQVQAVEMVPSRRKNRMVNFAIAKIDFTKGDKGVVEAVRTVLSNMKVKPNSKVNVSIDTNDVDMQWINRPTLRDVELGTKLGSGNYQDGEDEIIQDEYSIPTNRLFRKRSAMIRVEANRSLLDKQKNMIESAGFTCGNIDVEPFSLLNGFLASGPVVDSTKSIALVNVGAEKTTVNIVKNKVLYYTKTFSLQWRNLFGKLPEIFNFEANCDQIEVDLSEDDKEVYKIWGDNKNKLIDKLLMSFKLYEYEQSGWVQEVYVCGEIAAYKNFEHYFRHRLGIKVLKWDPANKVSSSKKQKNAMLFRKSSMALTIPIGLASHRFCSLNLRLKTKKKKEASLPKNKKNIFKIVAGLILGFAAIFAIGFFAINSMMYTQKIIPNSFIGKNKAEVRSELGDPVLKDYNYSDDVFDEEWIFYARKNSALVLVIQFKNERVVNSFFKK